MVKKKWRKRGIAFILAAITIFANVLLGFDGSSMVQAAAAKEGTNLLQNPTFEEGVDFSPANGEAHTGNWYYWKGVEKTNEDAHEGSYSAKLSGNSAALEQDIPDLQVGKTYVYRVWARLSKESTEAKHWIGVKNYGGSEVKLLVDSTDWKLYNLEFAYTSEVSNARVYAWVEEAGEAEFYVDDARLEEKNDGSGSQTETGREDLEVTPDPGDKEVTGGNGNVYYVSNEGNDTNDGLSENTAFKTIDKLNTIIFQPGDKILFKNGDTFIGCFKPQGSGTARAPITIDSYGDETEGRPVLQPGEDFTVPCLMSANAMVKNPTVNYVIWFYNLEYWEVSGLELKDPKHEATFENPGEVYRSGITIQAEDIGTLEHLYVDNIIIHGFHGPRTNIGKSSGGITMNVITNAERNRELSVPTQINDIRITNCEIYNVGRSGINFLTPWSFRNEEKWGPFNYGTKGYDYLPYENFYMANNYIHDIDGDGAIIDNCSGAVIEYNLVTRCVLRCNNAAVGMFNWNSNDTCFQFNEVFDIRYGGNDSNHLNDSQGIEIDALNDRTWVQYNYVHDNTGGFMMLCNIGDQYRSFDGIIRYNISQNDYAHPRQGMFDIYAANYGTEVYNNTFYFTERAVSKTGYGSQVKPGELFLFSAVGAREPMKFYNNIFYYEGETPVAANNFGDASIDWQGNIFYGFTNLPENDNPKAPNLNTDPKLVNPGAGAAGSYSPGKQELGRQVDLSCYHLQPDSPAINAGVVVEDNGGRDYFGNPLTGGPDIGAHEYQQ